MIAIDTNLLIYAHRSATPEHEAARKLIEQACCDPRGWGISLPSIAEFWSVVTHPAAAGRPSTGEEASSFIRSLIDGGGAQLWLPGPWTAVRLVQLASDLGVFGVRIFDLQISVIAFENGASEIWTHDRGFTSIPGLRVKNPLRHP